MTAPASAEHRSDPETRQQNQPPPGSGRGCLCLGFFWVHSSRPGVTHSLYHTAGKPVESPWGVLVTTLWFWAYHRFPGLMVWKRLWITPYAVLGALRPPEEKKARLRLTATPPLSWIEIGFLSLFRSDEACVACRGQACP